MKKRISKPEPKKVHADESGFTAVSFRNALRNAVDKLAASENRSRGNMFEVLVREALSQRERGSE